jgi:hypothetical protein
MAAPQIGRPRQLSQKAATAIGNSPIRGPRRFVSWKAGCLAERIADSTILHMATTDRRRHRIGPRVQRTHMRTRRAVPRSRSFEWPCSFRSRTGIDGDTYGGGRGGSCLKPPHRMLPKRFATAPMIETMASRIGAVMTICVFDTGKVFKHCLRRSGVFPVH